MAQSKASARTAAAKKAIVAKRVARAKPTQRNTAQHSTAQRSTAQRSNAADIPKVLVLSGPNLDRLGQREPHIYGGESLGQIYARLSLVAEELGVTVDCRQSNHEGLLVDWIGAADEQGFSAILINAGAYTHTSIALYDALRTSPLPAVEVHLSNPAAREQFRHHSALAAACVATVAGFRGESYIVALWGVVSAALSRLQASQQKATRGKSRAERRSMRRSA